MGGEGGSHGERLRTVFDVAKLLRLPEFRAWLREAGHTNGMMVWTVPDHKLADEVKADMGPGRHLLVEVDPDAPPWGLRATIVDIPAE